MQMLFAQTQHHDHAPLAPLCKQGSTGLGVSEGTVRIHLQNSYTRLQVSNRTAAVTRAFPDLAAA